MSLGGCESSLEVFDLPQFRLREMISLLEEEVRAWQGDLFWDYGGSSELVGQFIESQALSGMVLCESESPVGYSYYICEERKALMGCLFVSAPYRSAASERRLLGATLSAIRQRPGIQRVEAQFMLHPFPLDAPPLASHVEVHERLFMGAPLRVAGYTQEPAPGGRLLRVESWHERYQDRAAHLIEEAYRGHLDSAINDQYRSVEGARRFLYNIIQYPGCGSFANDASFVAVEAGSGTLMAACLASEVSPGVGHITQVCTHPRARGLGLGRHLIERSMQCLAARACQQVTLTVTAANSSAVRLYSQLGFTVIRRFPAYVWENL
ncbi:MAG: N-acetyltransferase [Bryobacterales bacterium]|nr:N-acetyltransferase [Bryobacterales bacterium]